MRPCPEPLDLSVIDVSFISLRIVLPVVKTFLKTTGQVVCLIKPQFEEMDETALATIIKRYQEQDTWKTDLVFSREAFDLLQDILLDAGVVQVTSPYEDLVNTKFAEKVK